MSVKYVGADVHKSTTTMVVKDESGKTVGTSVMETKEENLKAFVKAIPGTVHLTVEQSMFATWLYDMLHPHVAELVVCDPRRNRLITENEKNDELDAEALAELLRTGWLKPVYHGESSTRELREFVRTYDKFIKDRTRTKNRLRLLFVSHGVETRGRNLYTPNISERNAFIDELSGRGMKSRATHLYTQLTVQDDLVDLARKEMLAEGRKFEAVKNIKTVPGFGAIRASQLVGWVQTPHRFRTKRQLWKYMGLAVVTKSSSDWEVTAAGLKRKKQAKTWGLNQQFHRPLKSIIKGATKDASTQCEAWKNHFEALVDDGMRPDMARLTIARKLASTVLSIWKKGVKYEEQHAVLRS
jgi:transposase